MNDRVVSTAAMILAFSAGIVLSQDKGGKGGGEAPAGPGLTLSSPDFQDGGIIPDKFSQKGGQNGPSPKLEWTNVPMGTQSFVLLFRDPDVALQKKIDDVTHWMAFNIPGTAKERQVESQRMQNFRTEPFRSRIRATTLAIWALEPV